MSRGRPSKRQHIIGVARALFAAHGYQGTSIDQVVTAAGVSKPTVYNNFPTKLSLLSALLEALIEELEALFIKTEQSEKSGCRAVIAFYAQLLQCPEHLLAFRLTLGEAYKLDIDADALLTTYMERLKQYRERLLAADSTQVDATQLALLEAVVNTFMVNVALVGDEPDQEGVLILAHRALQL